MINTHHEERHNQKLDYYFGTKAEYDLDLCLSYICNSRNRFHLWICITAIGIKTIYLFFPSGFKFCSVGARCHPGCDRNLGGFGKSETVGNLQYLCEVQRSEKACKVDFFHSTTRCIRVHMRNDCGVLKVCFLNERMWKVPRSAFVFLPSIAIAPLFKNTECNWPAALSVYDLH